MSVHGQRFQHRSADDLGEERRRPRRERERGQYDVNRASPPRRGQPAEVYPEHQDSHRRDNVRGNRHARLRRDRYRDVERSSGLVAATYSGGQRQAQRQSERLRRSAAPILSTHRTPTRRQARAISTIYPCRRAPPSEATPRYCAGIGRSRPSSFLRRSTALRRWLTLRRLRAQNRRCGVNARYQRGQEYQKRDDRNDQGEQEQPIG